MEGTNFELKQTKAESRDSIELVADLEAIREAAQDLRGLESDDVVLKSKADVQPFVDAYQKSLEALDGLDDATKVDLMLKNNLYVFPGSSRLQ